MLQSFDALEKIVQQYYSIEDQQIISCPTQNQVRQRMFWSFLIVIYNF